MMKITGYADKISAVPGETISFMVNSEIKNNYRADIVRLICGDENPDGPGYKEKVIKTYNDKFYRLWLFYLASCESAFRWTDQCNFQILLNKDINISPRTRGYIYS